MWISAKKHRMILIDIVSRLSGLERRSSQLDRRKELIILYDVAREESDSKELI